MHATPETAPGPDASTRERLLKPLAGFYESAGHPLPEVHFIAPEKLPEPYRSLLVHDRDMTSTLQRFHDAAIRVRAIDSRHSGGSYAREVLLVTRDTETTVEFGAIEISLDRLPPGAQGEILREEMPLGAILQSFRIDYKSSPQAFFEIFSNDVMTSALQLSQARNLYGRCNEITNPKGALIAAIVEILPPANQKEHHA